ncbi:MAG: hypothetical protein JETCAE03_32590 [Ignavibacteriaceae bacterium]|jgi:hypothetical protein|nr:MAG: hypothetical protein JETCAE03_32590 [Ignavibacteriaceae bacterium]
MIKLYVMSCCDDDGREYDLWFDENNKFIGGYDNNDAVWRDEYMSPIFKIVGIEIKSVEYNKKIAKKARKEMWGY